MGMSLVPAAEPPLRGTKRRRAPAKAARRETCRPSPSLSHGSTTPLLLVLPLALGLVLHQYGNDVEALIGPSPLVRTARRSSVGPLQVQRARGGQGNGMGRDSRVSERTLLRKKKKRKSSAATMGFWRSGAGAATASAGKGKAATKFAARKYHQEGPVTTGQIAAAGGSSNFRLSSSTLTCLIGDGVQIWSHKRVNLALLEYQTVVGVTTADDNTSSSTSIKIRKPKDMSKKRGKGRGRGGGWKLTAAYSGEGDEGRGGTRSRGKRRSTAYASLAYYSNTFSELVGLEFRHEKDVIAERVCSWFPNRLCDSGYALFGMVATTRGRLFKEHVVRFSLPILRRPSDRRTGGGGFGRDNGTGTDKVGWTGMDVVKRPPLPFHRFTIGDVLTVTPGRENPIAPDGTLSPATVEGVVVARTKHYVDVVMARLPIGMAMEQQQARAGGKRGPLTSVMVYRLDQSVNGIAYERQFDALRQLTHPDEAPMCEALRDLLTHSLPPSLAKVEEVTGGRRRGEMPLEAHERTVVSSTGGVQTSRGGGQGEGEGGGAAVAAAAAAEAATGRRVGGRGGKWAVLAGEAPTGGGHVNQKRVAEAARKVKQMGLLNERQALAVELALTRRVTLLQGPPGTGKTRTACQLLATLVSLRQLDRARSLRRRKIIPQGTLSTSDPYEPKSLTAYELDLELSIAGEDGGASSSVTWGEEGMTSTKAGSSSSTTTTTSSTSTCTSTSTTSSWKGGARVDGDDHILACAFSNVATDNLVEGLSELGLKVVRLGRPASVRSELWHLTLDGQLESHPVLLEARGKYKTAMALAAGNTGTGIGAGGTGAGTGGRGATLERKAMKRATREELQFAEMAAIRDIVLAADVVVSTCVGAGSARVSEAFAGGGRSSKLVFKTCLIDEASQATEPACLVPLIRGCERLVLVGDHKQLPPTVLSPEALDNGLAMSLFARLAYTGIDPVLLTLQYRMHPLIAHFPSRHFYNGRLGSFCKASDRLRPKGFPWPQPGHPVAFVAVARGHETRSAIGGYGSRGGHDSRRASGYGSGRDFNGGGRMESAARSGEGRDGGGVVVGGAGVGGEEVASSWCNAAEVDAVSRALETLLAADPNLRPHDIGIITPYSGQVRLLTDVLLRTGTGTGGEGGQSFNSSGRDLEGIEISSVDGYQGREKEVIILTAVRSNARGSVGFLTDWRRLNVAVTRAKRGLIVVGNPSTLRNDRNWAAYLRWCTKNGVFMSDADL